VKVVRYFAYGSNMHEEDLKRWCRERGYRPIRPLKKEVAVLKDYRLVFNYYSSTRGGGVANIVESEGDEVWGILMELNEKDYKKIMKKEGAPYCYKEITVSVIARDGRTVHDVKTFKVVEELEEDRHVPPTREYLNLLVEVAEKYNFPEWYIRMLRSIKTKD